MFRGQRGDLATYLAAVLVLPLLAVAGAGGAAVLSLFGQQADLAQARAAAELTAEIDGGVSSQVVQQTLSVLTQLGVPTQGVVVSGTPPPVPWGGSITVTVTRSVLLTGFPWDLLGLAGHTVILGGTTVTTSNGAP